MIAEIEQAIIAKIQGLQDDGTLGYTLKTLKTYGGEFADGLDRAVLNFPAILILFAGGPISKVGQEYRVTARFLIPCAAGSLRNEQSSRHGEGGKVGSYQLALDVIKILKNQKLGLEIEPIIPTNIRPLLNDKAGAQLASVYGVDIETAFYTEELPPVGNIGNFVTAHANWDVPPHGDFPSELPVDDTSDATDHVTLPQ